jgi:type I restriction enzyme S subunit
MSGELPSGWEATTLGGQLAAIRGGGTPSRDNPAYWNGRIPWASVKDVTHGGISHPQETISELGLVSSASQLIPARTVVIATRMAVGRTIRFAVDVAINQDLKALFANESLLEDFLFQWLSWMEPSISAKATGSTVKGIRTETLAQLPMRLPPLPEQKKIAAILSSVDEAIQATQAVIDQTRRVKEGLLQELLTRGIGHTRFKMTEVGEIPEGWTVRKLRDLGIVDSGKAKNSGQASPWRPYLRSANVLDDEIDASDVYSMPFSDAEFEQYKLRPGDILLNEGQSIDLVGRPAVYLGIPPEVAMQNALIRWRPEPRTIDPEFAYQTVRLMYQSGAFRQVATQTTSIAHLGLRRFADLSMAVPPLSEQRAIADVLRGVDSGRRAGEANRRRLLALKSGLLTDLLSGKVRVRP